MRRPHIWLMLAAIAFAASLAWTAGKLPDRVASHFGWGGIPDDYMTRANYISTMLALGIGVTLLFLSIVLLVHKIPPQFMNLPHREYWLAVERRAETHNYLSKHCLWLPTIMLLFLAGVHLLVVYANQQAPVQMASALMFTLAGCMLLAILCWAGVLLRHFSRPPTP